MIGFQRPGAPFKETDDTPTQKRKPVNKSVKRKSVKKIVRRGKRKSMKNFTKSLRFLGVNANGLK